MQRKKKSKKEIQNVKKAIFVLLVICIALLIVTLIIYNNPTNKNLRYIYNAKKQGNIEIMPTNIDQLFVKYQGNIEQRSLYKAMYLFVDELVEKYYLKTKDMNNEEIRGYFKNNSETIEKELGIVEEEVFYEFCEDLKNNLDGENLELVSYTINPNSIKKLSSQTKCSIIVKYNNNQKIAFNLLIQRYLDESKTPIYYEACIDENILSYEYIENDYETPDSIEPTGKVIK